MAAAGWTCGAAVIGAICAWPRLSASRAPAPCANGARVVRHAPVSTEAETSPTDAAGQSASEAPPLAVKVMLVTDAWEPQVNGVVRTLANTMRELKEMGCEIEVVSPADYPNSVPLITYSEIRLALGARDDV